MDERQARCIVCHEVKPEGIRICGRLICVDCERDIVATDVTDARYRYYIDCMKQIWLEAIS